MSAWAPRRFWTEARAEAVEGGHAVRLDGREVVTPGKARLVLPTRALAEAAAAEWAAQEERIDPRSMPVTAAANTALDKVIPQRPEIEEGIAGYAGTDLLCYRAESPAELVARQREGWDPALEWGRETLGIALVQTVGIAPVPQPESGQRAARRALASLNPFALTAMHDLVALSGSFVLGFAAAYGWRSAGEVWDLSRIDETWQAEQWGEDAEAVQMAATKRAAFMDAVRFFTLARSGGTGG